jgi:dTDP-4-amino-4,6-dideoxygalactose transaminase
MPQHEPVMIRGSQQISFSTFSDAKRGGTLTFGQLGDHVPFPVKRFFLVHDTPTGCKRGAHAHRRLLQCLVCVKGAVLVSFDNGRETSTVTLSSPHEGLVLDPMVWSDQEYVEPGSVLLVLASEEYDESEYVRDYSEFRSLVNQLVGATATVTVVPEGRDVPTKGSATATDEVKKTQESKKKKNQGEIAFLDLRHPAKLQSRLVSACERVISSGIYVHGPDVALFEAEWATYCKTDHAVGVASGLDALTLMLRGAFLETGNCVGDCGDLAQASREKVTLDEIIVPANTYIATVLGVTMAGFAPVFVEPDPNTHNIDPARVVQAITPKTCAILAVDLYGLPADVSSLRSIADRHGLRLFCDAAQSHGAEYDGRRACSAYDATAFSFYPSKNLGALGEAGAVVTNDAAIADRVRVLRNYGSRVRYENEYRGVNARMDTIQAAMLREKLPLLDQNNASRAKIAEVYLRELRGLPWLRLPRTYPEICKHVWHQFVVCVDDRDGLRAHLETRGIPTLVHYPIPPHLSGAYADLGLKRGDFPVTEGLAAKVLSLPMGPHMTEKGAARVAASVRSFPVSCE